MIDMQAEYDAAVVVRDDAQAALGEAILAGKDTTQLNAKLAEAEQAVLGCAMAREAIVAANQRAERKVADEAAVKRRAAIEAHWQQAEVDYADIVATANALQKSFDKQRDLVARLHKQSRDFADKHRVLGANPNAMQVLSYNTWQAQMLLLMRETFPGMRERMQRLNIGASELDKSLVDSIPSFERLLPPRAKREAA